MRPRFQASARFARSASPASKARASRAALPDPFLPMARHRREPPTGCFVSSSRRISMPTGSTASSQPRTPLLKTAPGPRRSAASQSARRSGAACCRGCSRRSRCAIGARNARRDRRRTGSAVRRERTQTRLRLRPRHRDHAHRLWSRTGGIALRRAAFTGRGCFGIDRAARAQSRSPRADRKLRYARRARSPVNGSNAGVGFFHASCCAGAGSNPGGTSAFVSLANGALWLATCSLEGQDLSAPLH